MSEKTWDNCEWFGELNTCPKSKEDIMIQFRRDVALGEGYENRIDFSKGPEINEKFCHNCDSWKAGQSIKK